MASKRFMIGLLCITTLGIRVASAEPTHHDASTATLKTIMRQLGHDMNALSAALWLQDFAGIARAATAIADHPHVSPHERARVQRALGATFAAFGTMDRRVHDAAVRTAAAAKEQDLDQVLSELGSLQAGCVACHDAFRVQLLESMDGDDATKIDAPASDRGPGHKHGEHSSRNGGFTAPERDAIQRAEDATKALGKTLKDRLITTMQTQGPVAAMGLCTTQAQDLTRSVAAEESVAVGRSSLRLRNPKNAAPDWVDTWLHDQGEGPAAGVVGSSEIAMADDGSEVARVLRPLAVGPPCLACHGDRADLAPEILASLDASYPKDRATGYLVGDLRGVIWAEAKVAADRH